jgi:hypothetical protein
MKTFIYLGDTEAATPAAPAAPAPKKPGGAAAPKKEGIEG